MDAVASWVAPMAKNLPANAEDPRDTGLIPWCGRSFEVGNDTLLKNSCLKNSMSRGAWGCKFRQDMDVDPVGYRRRTVLYQST